MSSTIAEIIARCRTVRKRRSSSLFARKHGDEGTVTKYGLCFEQEVAVDTCIAPDKDFKLRVPFYLGLG